MASVLSQNLFDLLSDDQPTEVSAPAKPQPVPAKSAPVKEKVDRKDQSVRSKTHRGGKGGRGGKREFDRRSGTGRIDGEKKEIAGKGSWGNPTETPEETEKTLEKNEEIKEAEPVEEEEPKMTLDQYLAQRKKTNASEVKRRANEGADESQWKDAVVLEKEAKEYLVLAKPSEQAPKQKNKPVKQIVEIEQKFNDSSRSEIKKRGDGPRGGRDAPRGGRDAPRGTGRGDASRGGRGDASRGGRGGQDRSRRVDVRDEKAFPTLGR